MFCFILMQHLFYFFHFIAQEITLLGAKVYLHVTHHCSNRARRRTTTMNETVDRSGNSETKSQVIYSYSLIDRHTWAFD